MNTKHLWVAVLVLSIAAAATFCEVPTSLVEVAKADDAQEDDDNAPHRRNAPRKIGLVKAFAIAHEKALNSWEGAYTECRIDIKSSNDCHKFHYWFSPSAPGQDFVVIINSDGSSRFIGSC